MFLPKLPPSSLRPSIPSPTGPFGSRSPESRPYLVGSRFRRIDETVRTITSHTTMLFPHESEDARLTGSTRSLYRRLLALNLPLTTQQLSAGPKPSKPFSKTA